jgi:hypothetical protein
VPIARTAKLAAPLLLLVALAGCFEAHPQSDGGTAYATRPAFYWTMLGGFVFFLVFGWALIHSEPGGFEGWMTLLAATVPLGVMLVGLDNRWTVGPDGFTPPRRFTGFRQTAVAYADVQGVEVVSNSTGKGRLDDWEIRVRGRAGVLRIGRPDDPVRPHLEREFHRHRIPMSSRDAGLSGHGLMFGAKIFGVVFAYMAVAGMLAAWAGPRAKRKQSRKPQQPEREGEAMSRS